MERKYKTQIAHEFDECISNTIIRLKNEDTYRPFHSALLSEDALFWSRFERSFSTSFGQRAIQEISRLAALAGGAKECNILRETSVSLKANQLSAINDHVTKIRGGNLSKPVNWARDLREIREASRGRSKIRVVRVISDLWYVRNRINHYISIKTVKPNIDQTAEAKRDLLKLRLGQPNCKVFFGLYYNPYGE